MKSGKFRFLSLCLIATLFAIFGTIFVSNALASSPSNILVNIVPENPAPNESTKITLSSYANNLDSVLITWSVDGRIASSGIGKKLFSLNAPATGKEIIVTAKIELPDGDIEKRVTIRPEEMVLLWQAEDSYVPPFYRGKALPTPDSSVKVVAFPEIKVGSQPTDSKNMIYAWKQNYNNDQEGSGYGKNYFVYSNDYLDSSNNIGVTASTTDQKYSSTANIDIGTTQAKILFYKNDAALGTIWEETLKDGHRINGDEVMEAAPYFISPKDIRIPILTWNWSINGSWVNVFGFRKNLMPLKVQAGVSGTSKIGLEIENSYKIFGTASREINVTF